MVAVFIGMLTIKRTQLRAPFIEAFVAKEKLPTISIKWINLAIVVSFIGSLLVFLLDCFVFMPQIILSSGSFLSVTLWHGFLMMFYGGIIEELLLRYFLLGLFV